VHYPTLLGPSEMRGIEKAGRIGHSGAALLVSVRHMAIEACMARTAVDLLAAAGVWALTIA
jgi:hypothetical protein